MTSLAWLVPVLPFAAALIGLGMRRAPAVPAVAGAALATVVALGVLIDGSSAEHSTRLTPTGAVDVFAGVRVDGLSAVVAVMVCVVALLVQVYSVGYLRGDRRYAGYAATVSLFTAAMLDVVLAADLFQLLVGWEVMGVCSYLLIGHYREQPAASAAAVKAFLTTRVGDVGFLFGIFVLGLGAGSFRITSVLTADLPHVTVVAGTLLLACGVVGKSAQFPLHTWLPDAMAGPTPISALIHAATMVAAGVYVIARLFPLFLRSSVTLDVLAVVAAVTMVLAALAALAQDDLKRVLAYSTVSQLAYMVGGLAAGGYDAGVFHLLTHAAFKALLFLCAGSVIRTVGTNLMSEMGGLRRGLPVTFATTTAGLAALAGLPPFAGFWSKDAVLEAAREAGGLRGEVVLVAGMLTVALTAAYVARLWLRTFFGVRRGGAAVHESPWSMRGPLLVLAVPSALLGLVGPALYDRLAQGRDVGVSGRAPLPAELPSPGHFSVDAATATVSTVLALAGIAVVVLLWRHDPVRDPVAVLAPGVRRALDRAFYLDELYDAVLVRPLPRLARVVRVVDERGVDAVVEGSGRTAVLLGGGLRVLQNGNVQLYATGLLTGVLALVVALAARA